MPAPIPPDEEDRLAELRAAEVLDTEPEEIFDRLTRLASRILGTPIALVSLVDADRQWFKSIVGLDVRQTSRSEAFCAHALSDSSVLTVPDATRDERFMDNPLVLGHPDIRFYAGAPLRTSTGHNLGTLCVIDTEPRELTEDELSILEDLAAIATRELELRIVANTDRLTGALNREQFHLLGEREFRRAVRHEQPLSVAMLDVDHFKSINDRYGHMAGDRMLATVSQCCAQVTRTEEALGRLGGDEFAIVFYGTTREEASVALDRVLAAVTEESTCQKAFRDVRLSLSAGVAQRSQEDRDFAGLLERADKCLYEAKGSGRGIIVTDG